jgi:hypothetical protein
MKTLLNQWLGRKIARNLSRFNREGKDCFSLGIGSGAQ